jgi:hypothetical protein
MTITSESSAAPNTPPLRSGALICGVAGSREILTLGYLDFDRDRRRHLRQAQDLLRPAAISHDAADPSLTRGALRWQTHTDVDQVTRRLYEAAAASLRP